ncbi:hypothetical protein XM47_17855 [Catenovulum maritimum]|uniref:TonB-dependent receptor n=2 Tax=Catenovulum maritimum TaxID=1513271 RepID=A0A0J8GLU8_9ALTE|nr:hypothetical protein XM47_17855 [Catenovulum maritimum]
MPIEQLMQLNVASATLTDETILSVPSSVAVFSNKDIKRLGLDTLDELLNFVTGVQSTQGERDSRFNKVSFRGRTSGSGGSEVLILLNGQRVNSEYSGSNDYTVPMIPLSFVDKIEVIKGSGSAIYGSNAFLGVINIITKTNLSPSIYLATGNLDSREFSASAGFELDDFTLQATFAIGDDKGDIYLDEMDTFTPNMKMNLSDPKSHKDIIINAGYKNTNLNVFYTNQSSDDFYVQGHISKGYNHTETSALISNLKHKLSWSEDFYSELMLDYRVSKAKLFSQVTPENTFSLFSIPQSNEALKGITPIEERAVGLRFNHFYTVNPNLDLSFGLEYRKSKLLKTESLANYDYFGFLLAGGTPPITYFGGEFNKNTPFVAPSRRDISAGFLQTQYKISDSTELTFGLRYDSYSDIGNNLSPRFSVVSHISETNTVKFNFGEAYRAPQFNELNLLNNPSIESNPNLNPETIVSYDVIWLFNSDEFNFTTTYFKHSIDDAIVTPLQEGRVQLINLSDKQKTSGLEFESTWAAKENLSIKLGATHLFSSPNDQYRESKNTLFGIVNYEQDAWNFNLSINHQSAKETPVEKIDIGLNRRNTSLSNSDSVTTDTKRLASYTIVNTKISYSYTQKLDLFFKAKNLFNEKYRTPSLSNQLNNGVPNRGVEWMFGAEMEF